MRRVLLVGCIAILAAVPGCTQRGLETVQNTYAAEPYVANFHNLNRMHDELDRLERALHESQVPKAIQWASSATTVEGRQAEQGALASAGGWLSGWWPFSPHIKEVEDTATVRCVGFTEDANGRITWNNEYDILEKDEGYKGTKDKNARARLSSDCQNVGKIPAKILTAYVRGRAVETDGYCHAFFTGLDKLSSNTRYTRDFVNDSLNLTNIILGLTKSAASQLAILAGAQAFVSNQFDSFERFMLLAPEPFRVHKFVRAKQKEFREQGANAVDSLVTLDQAQRWVRDYANLCTIKGIKQIVDEAIGANEIQIEKGGQRKVLDASISQLTVITAAMRNAAGNNLDAVKHRQMATLYWFFVLRNAEQPEGKKLDKDGETKELFAFLSDTPKLVKYLKAVKDLTKPADDATDEKKKSWELYERIEVLIRQYGEDFPVDITEVSGSSVQQEAAAKRKAFYDKQAPEPAQADQPAPNPDPG